MGLTDFVRVMRAPAIACALILAMAGCGDAVPRVAPVGPDDVVVAFGDSLTYGTGAKENESYPAVLARLIGRKVVRSGVPGEVTSQGLARLEETIDEHRPSLMIICLGGNDMLRKVSDGEIRSNLREIVRTIRDRGVAVMLIGVPRPALITSAAPFYAEIAEEFGIPYQGSIVTDVLYRRELKSDPIHPNALGYRKMAEAVAELMRKAGAI